MDRTYCYTICEQDLPATVGSYLRKSGYSRHLLTHLKQTPEGILINGIPVFTNRKLSPGDHLRVFLQEEETARVRPQPDQQPLPFPIIYQDEDLILVDKPAGMAVHPSLGHHGTTLADAAAQYFSHIQQPFVFRCINRLDRDTTGLLILACNALSASLLSAQMKLRQIHRTYLAVAEGIAPEYGILDAPIGRVPGSLVERRIDPVNGQQAVTCYRRLATGTYRLPSGDLQDCSLMQIHLKTGRTHQIRVHMASMGHPLAGDTLYNPGTRLLKRQGLHSCLLEFLHPITGSPMRFFSPLPRDMSALFPDAAALGENILWEPQDFH